MTPSRDIARLLDIMAALRTPGTGCAWDLAQTFETILPYTIEEAFEVADAIERRDRADLAEELGDLLLQVVFHARMAEEEGAFDFGDVVEAITAKLIRRHPHVFSTARNLPPEAVKAIWAQVKAQEKAERRARRPDPATPGLLADIPGSFPPLLRAEKLQARAAKVGFDWNDPAQVLAKIREETEEVEQALAGQGPAAVQDEIGDLLFAVVNLARKAKVEPDRALRRANAKFIRRFAHIESSLATRGSNLESASLAEMEALWIEAKHEERSSPDP